MKLMSSRRDKKKSNAALPAPGLGSNAAVRRPLNGGREARESQPVSSVLGGAARRDGGGRDRQSTQSDVLGASRKRDEQRGGGRR